MKSEYFPPTLGKSSYHCPFCNVFSLQYYGNLVAFHGPRASDLVFKQSGLGENLDNKWIVTKCHHCNGVSFWIGEKLIFPRAVSTPQPNPDLPDNVKNDYIEAANIFQDSPRAAAALLRLGLQKLCKFLDEKGDNINDDIKSMVKKGLNVQVQQALDALRITGNNAVHPGSINLEENPELVKNLFDLINFIAAKMITEPKEIDIFYKNLPEDARKAVEKRDA